MDKVKVDFTERVLSYLGVPFVHQGRNRTAGLDCVGLIVVAMQDVGLPVNDRTGYKRQPEPQELINAVLEHTIPKDKEKVSIGDILLIKIGDEIQHLAVCLSEDYLIHACSSKKRVLLQKYTQGWRKRTVGVYSIV